MLYVEIEPPSRLTTGTIVEETHLQLSEDKEFNDIVVDDKSSSELYQRSINEALNSGQVYYLRARYKTNDLGYEDWSPVEVFNAGNVNKVRVRFSIPKSSYPPEISINIPERDQMPLTHFTVNLQHHPSLSKFVTGASVIIESLDGKLKYVNTHNHKNLFRFYIDSFLEMNKAFVIKAATILDCGTVSELASFVIKTTTDDDGCGFIVHYERVIYGVRTVDVIPTLQPTNYKETEVEIWNRDGLFYNFSTTDKDINLKPYAKTDDQITFVRVRAKTTLGVCTWRYIYSRDGHFCALPIALPVKLNCGAHNLD